MIDLNELRVADFVELILRGAGTAREGSGAYALALAYRLNAAGVQASEFATFCEKLADRLRSEYSSQSVSEGTRQTLLASAAEWKGRSPEFAQLLELSARSVTTGKGLALLVVHLGRITDQLALLQGIKAADKA